MESEKAKEIKELFKNCDFTLKHCGNCVLWKDEDCIETIKSKVLTLINDLESENERLKWEKQTLEDKDTLLAKVGELSQENQQLKDQIAELEKENEILRKHNIGYHIANNYEAQEQLKQFAERLKEKLKDNVNGENVDYYVDCAIYIDETLKEFMG